VDVPMDIGKVQAFLNQLGQSAGVAQTAADNGPAIGAYLLTYILGSSPTSSDGLDGILATLMSTWSGDAADAFKAQAQTVRGFGIGVAALADKTVNAQPTGVQMPAQMQYELGSMTDYTGAASTLNQLFSATHTKYTAATSDFPNWAQYLAGVMRDTSDNIRNNTLWSTNTTVTVHVPTFAEYVAGKRGPGGVTGVLSVDFSNSNGFDPGTSKVSYHNPQYGSGFDMTIGWPFWKPDEGALDSKNQAAIKQYTQDSEYDNYLRTLMADLGSQYPQVQAPRPQDNSVLPKTNGTSSTTQPNPGSYPGGYGGLGAGTALGGVTNGNVPGYGTGSANGGSGNPGSGYNPGSASGGTPAGGYGGDAYVPGGYNPGPNAGGWNPTQLAGYNPNAGGVSGPATTGFAAGGPGAFGGGASSGVAGAGGANGLAAGAGPDGGLAADTGAAAAAGRAMPMAPMAGAGGGKDRGERQRAAWLTEDEDVWGADADGGDAVL
jgi:hypothetical protein